MVTQLLFLVRNHLKPFVRLMRSKFLRLIEIVKSSQNMMATNKIV